MFLHQFLEHERRRDVHGHPGVVPFAMTGSAFDHGIVIGDAWFLRGSGDTVDVGDESNHWLAGTVSRDPSRRNSRHATFDRKSVFLQQARHILRSLNFLKAQFAEAKNLIHHLLDELLPGVHLGERFFLQSVEVVGLRKTEQ